MINIGQETLLTPAEAARRLPSRRQGRRVHSATVYRWIATGINGIHLEAIRIGGSLLTSVEALQRFAERLTISRHVNDSDESLSRPDGRPKDEHFCCAKK